MLVKTLTSFTSKLNDVKSINPDDEIKINQIRLLHASMCFYQTAYSALIDLLNHCMPET